MDTTLISKRAVVARDWEDFLLKYLTLCVQNSYHEESNPMGYVNLGTAVNNLCMDIIQPRLTSNEIWSCDTSLLQYNECFGIPRLREAFAKIITEFLEPHEPVSPDNLICVSGATSCIDLLAYCLADPGEVFLVPTPMYGRICTDFKQRALVDVWPIPIITENNTEDFPELTIDKVVNAYEKAIKAKRCVRGILLINPSNPLGDIYSPKLLWDILSFCKQKSLHIIVDEVYALSVFSKTEKFHSILKFADLPDPERTHMLYGLSKDFGIAGLRIGVIHTKSKPLKKSLIQLSFFNNIPFPIMKIAANYLEDDFGTPGLRIGVIHTKCESLSKSLRQLSNFSNIPFPVMKIAARYLDDIEWLKEYININQQRLAEKFELCAKNLKKLGLNVRDSSAGFFVWVDLRHLCGSSFDKEREFFNYLIEKAHLYIGPGKEYFCSQPGWFRIVFTESPHHLIEGLSRLERALQAFKSIL